jgi:hypothetical protein
MLRIIQRFGKHCSCYLQGEYVMIGRFLKPYMGQAVGDELGLMVLIGGAHLQLDSSQLFRESTLSNPTRHLLPALYNTSKNAQPLHIHPEYGNCSICQNVG